MADAAVGFLLSTLRDLLLNQKDLIDGFKDVIQCLEIDLKFIKSFLKDSWEKRNESEKFEELLIDEIRDVAYEVEDIIDNLLLNEAMPKGKRIARRMSQFLFPNKTLETIKSIKKKLDTIYENKVKYGIVSLEGEQSIKVSQNKRAPVVEEVDVVGFDEEAKTVLGLLTQGSKQLDIVTIVGMGGLGKTTLAKKVYSDPIIEYNFYCRTWIYLSQEYSRKEVFLRILESLRLANDRMSNMSAEGLAEELKNHLVKNKYLIVIDDVWTKDAWDDISTAFPKTNNGSRILLTSRLGEVALHANFKSIHNLRFLTDEESWELLCLKTFRRGGNCPSELEELGKQIAKKCYGLPLTIVLVSGLLIKKGKTREWWKKIGENVNTSVAKEAQCKNVLGLSFKHLPDHLKNCFIYFGLFPEDFEIPVWKMIRLWVAEGFVIQENGQECSEDSAEEYLEDLVDRNLVLVAKRGAYGRIKTCRIHDMLRDQCVLEGTKQKIMQVIKGSTLNHSGSTSSPKFPRLLSIHSNALDFISSKPSGPHVRSLLCFSVEEKEVPRSASVLGKEFGQLIKVLDFRPMKLSCFPSAVTPLYLLRFLSLYGNFKTLPKAISNLVKLQTIIIVTTCRELKIEADIWKMSEFKHLYTSGISSLDGSSSPVKGNILTLSTISPASCTEKILVRTPHLRKLGIRGEIALLLKEKEGSTLFDNITKLEFLKTMKLLNDTFSTDPSICMLPGLPLSNKFPPNLVKLTLSETCIDWIHMSILGMLENLEVLKLKDNAFKGSRWEPLNDGFCLLKFLQIGKTDLQQWDASGNHFPKLQHLILNHCSSLEEIPSGFAEISTLQHLELLRPTASAAMSARKIQEKIQDKEQQGECNAIFKLQIYPPDI